MRLQTVTSPSPAKAVIHPLRNSNFRLLWTGATVSVLGDQFYLVALPWLILQLTNFERGPGHNHDDGGGAPRRADAAGRGGERPAFAAQGHDDDRFDPQQSLWAQSALCCGSRLASSGISMCWGSPLECADAFGVPAAQAFMPSLSNPSSFPPPNSVSQVSIQLSTIVGPAPAGLA